MLAPPARLVALVLALSGCVPSSANPTGASRDEPTPPATPARTPPPPASVRELAAPGPAPASASLAPAPPPVPSLDELRTEARRDLGERVAFALVRDHYLVVSAPGWGATGARSSADFVDRVLTALHTERFARGPSRPLPVYLFADEAAYNAYCQQRYGSRCISIYGFFSPSDYRLVMNVGLGIGTLSHELVHPLVDADFPAAPTWLNEGIASLFEAPVMPRAGEIHGAKNWRYRRLSAALARPQERPNVTLPALFAMTDEVFRDENEDLHYAMARYFCQWLDAQGKLWDFYHAYRDHSADDPHGDKAFQQATGQTPAEASDAWLRWVRAL